MALWAVKMFLVAGALLLFQSVCAFLDGIRFLQLVRKSCESPQGSYTPAAAVVIPCKGVDAGFDANVDHFLHQEYPAYQVVFVVATSEDLAYQRLRDQLARPVAAGVIRNLQTSLVVAGVAGERGEKVNNLLRGVEAVNPGCELWVFADIDATPSSHWLRSLVAPLASPEVTVSTGFRWYLPGQGFVSRLRAAWDTSIATTMPNHNIVWGGSTAIRARDFRKLRIGERYWASTVSDDYAVARAVADAGGEIAFAPRCLVASREESGLWEFLRWSTRQIILTRVYAAHLWRLGLATYLLYCGTFILGLVVMTFPSATTSQRVTVVAILATVLGLGAAKGYIRSRVARRLFALETGASCYWQLSPLVPWVMLGNFVVAGFARRIEWRGTESELISRDKVRVVRRSGG